MTILELYFVYNALHCWCHEFTSMILSIYIFYLMLKKGMPAVFNATRNFRQHNITIYSMKKDFHFEVRHPLLCMSLSESRQWINMLGLGPPLSR